MQEAFEAQPRAMYVSMGLQWVKAEKSSNIGNNYKG